MKLFGSARPHPRPLSQFWERGVAFFDSDSYSPLSQNWERGRVPASRVAGVRAGLSLIALFPLALLLTGCPSSKNAPDTAPPNLTKNEDKSAGAFTNTDPWLLTTKTPNASRGNHGIFLSNGYLGMTFGANGGAGKDSVSYIAGRYDESENLKAATNYWHTLGLPEPGTGEKYEQTLDMKHGVLLTKMGNVTVTSLLHATNPAILLFYTEGATSFSKKTDQLPDLKDLDFFSRSQVNGNNTFDLTAVRSISGKPLGNWKQAQSGDFTKMLEEHKAAWEKRWQSADITIEGDPEAQQLVHKLMFDLMQSVRSGGDDSIAPESLSGNFYKGHIFWDAEVWMFPALLAQNPDLARNLLDYRFKHLEQAKAYAKAQGLAGADYPWESAASGKEVAPGGFSTGRHVTAGIGWAFWQYWLATGDKKWLAERGYPVLSAIADQFASRAKKNATTGKYEIKNVFGPDELKGKVDNNTYTNAMAANCLRYAGEASKILGKPANPKWAEVSSKLVLPFDKAKGVYLTRDKDDGSKTKQADGELLLWPAKLPMDKKTAEATFAYHAARPIKNGPAMTASIHALIAARLGQAKEAETYFRDSYRPFVRGPFLLFSEKRSLDRCVFTTGEGGILQSVLYGFGGLDFADWDGITKAPIALPPTWKKLTISGIRRLGKVYTLTVTPEGRTLTEQK